MTEVTHEARGTGEDAREESKGVMLEIQEALSSAWGRVGMGAAALGLIAGSFGCSPKDKSFWMGTYSTMPDPPAAARMQIGVSTESEGDLFINYVEWNSEADQFIRRDIHYTFQSNNPLHLTPLGNFREAGGYTQQIKDGEVLSGGIVVDQVHGALILPGGSKVDGRTGAVVSAEGDTIKTLRVVDKQPFN